MLEEFCVGVVRSRILVELLWRLGVGRIKYVSDFITPNDVNLDITLRCLDANDYDVLHPIGETKIYSYLYRHHDLKRALRGVDVIVAHGYLEESARVAEELGVPFLPNFVTIFLPDGISFFEIEKPKIRFDPVSYAMTAVLQANEIRKLLAGMLPILAPDVLLVDGGELRKSTLKRLII